MSEFQPQEQEAPQEEKSEYYCPECGASYNYPGKCSGDAEKGHPPTEVELRADGPHEGSD